MTALPLCFVDPSSSFPPDSTDYTPVNTPGGQIGQLSCALIVSDGPSQWRHMSVISNHRPIDGLFNNLFWLTTINHQTPYNWPFDWNPRVTVGSPTQRASNIERVSTSWRHYVGWLHTSRPPAGKLRVIAEHSQHQMVTQWYNPEQTTVNHLKRNNILYMYINCKVCSLQACASSI